VVQSCWQAAVVGRVIPLEADELLLGRGVEADLRLDDPGLSRRHARILRMPGGERVVADAGSMNGTWVNGTRVRVATLADGDRIQVGNATALRFSLRGEADSSEAALRSALTAGGVGTWEWDVRTGELRVSEEGARLLGHGAAAAPWDVLEAGDAARLRAALARAAADGAGLSLDCRVVPGDGRPAWVALRGDLFAGPDGKPARVAGTLLDVTPRKRLELELRRQALLFESLSDAAIVVEPDGTVADWNGAARALIGWSREEAVGRRLEDVIGTRGGPSITDALMDGVRTQGRWTQEVTLFRRDGGSREAELVAVPLAGADDRALACVVLCRDLGERRAMRSRMLLADRMNALGRLASGMAHEIRNPLSFVLSNLDYASAELSGPRRDEDEVRRAIADARVGAERILSVVRDLRFFVRGEDAASAGPVDLNEAVDFALRMTQNAIRHHAALEKSLGVLPPVSGSIGRFSQVFVNLLANAAQAVEAAGTPGPHAVRVRTAHDVEADRVVVEIEDSGAGMDEETAKRAFDPFFTTKKAGEGMGLGLAVCLAIVEGAGGWIDLKTARGEGTTFRISLPAARQRPAPAPEAAAPGAAPSPRRGRVLVVDDEPFVGAALARLLGARHDVVCSGSGAHALRRLEEGERFDAVLCDAMMPGMSGPDLLDRLRALFPEQADRLVFITGGIFSEAVQRRLDMVPNAKIAKGLPLEQLERLIADLVLRG
jgi:PAS domain S-box-containing protein